MVFETKFLAVPSIVMLLIACFVSLGAVQMFYPVASASFTLPCTINTYGNAWNGTLAYGLLQFNAAGHGIDSHLVVMNTDGQVSYLRSGSDSDYLLVKYVNTDWLLFTGEPGEPGGNAAFDMGATHILNLTSNVINDYLNVWGHHDIEYDPFNNTFLTLRDYVGDVNGTQVLFDEIVELNASGDVL
jgi:hypothetical protein